MAEQTNNPTDSDETNPESQNFPDLVGDGFFDLDEDFSESSKDEDPEIHLKSGKTPESKYKDDIQRDISTVEAKAGKKPSVLRTETNQETDNESSFNSDVLVSPIDPIESGIQTTPERYTNTRLFEPKRSSTPLTQGNGRHRIVPNITSFHLYSL